MRACSHASSLRGRRLIPGYPSVPVAPCAASQALVRTSRIAQSNSTTYIATFWIAPRGVVQDSFEAPDDHSRVNQERDDPHSVLPT
jgi:hypothetical protein